MPAKQAGPESTDILDVVVHRFATGGSGQNASMSAALRPQLSELQTKASELRQRAVRLKALPKQQLSWKPGAASWSIVQILDHLNRTHALCLVRFEEALETASDLQGDETIKFGMMDRVFLKFMTGEAPIKAPVPPIFEPEANPDPAQTCRRFFEYHDSLVKIIEGADRKQLSGLNVASPVSAKFKPGFLPYLTGLVLHEEYHLNQAETLLALPNFPK